MPGTFMRAGKSTLSASLVKCLAQIIPMDGFHYDNQYLAEQGLLAIKGAPQTFDASAFETLVKALRNQAQAVFAPSFDRDSEQVIENAQTIAEDSQIIIVEGNYLLLNQAPWDRLAQYFDTSIFIQVTQSALQQRLIQRWLDQGFDLAAAEKKAIGNDLVNAKLVIEQSTTADIYFSSDS